MSIPTNSCRLSSVDPTNTNTSKASRTTWLGMGLAERGDHMIVATNTLMGGVLCRQRHHRGCFVLRDAAVWRKLVDWNMLECTAEINTRQRLKKKREGVPTSMWVSDLRGTICVEVLLWLSVCCLGHTQKADEEGHSLEENEYASDTIPVNSS